MEELFKTKSLMGPVTGSKGNYATSLEHYNVSSDLIVIYEAMAIKGCGDPHFSMPDSVTIEVDCDDKPKREEAEQKLSDYLFPERKIF